MLRAPVPSIAPPPWAPMLPPVSSVDTSFWQSDRVVNHLRKLRDTINLLKSVQKELNTILLIKEGNCHADEVRNSPQLLLDNQELPFSKSASMDASPGRRNDVSVLYNLLEMVKVKGINLNAQEYLTLETVNSLLFTLKSQIVPLNVITADNGFWEEKSAAVRVANKQLKSKRNKRLKKKKRKYVAEMLHREHDMYEQVDKEADEWRAREIAKDIARRKVERMKEIARVKAEEDRKRLEAELELVLVVEKLQELRSIRIQKLKKQGHFLPEEDDKFLERVQAAVEEEERQVAAAADTEATKEAIASAEESRKCSKSTMKDGPSTMGTSLDATEAENGRRSDAATGSKPEQQSSEKQDSSREYNTVNNLPAEFYHYYHGSNTDMGTLIEVRRAWDAFIRPGGSRVPGHWVQSPPPADEIWASYLVGPK